MMAIRYLPVKMTVLAFIYFLAVDVSSTLTAPKWAGNSLFDYVANVQWGGSMSVEVLLLGILPFFALVLPQLTDRFENHLMVVRIRDKGKVLNQLVVLSVCFAALLTLITAATGIIVSLLATGHLVNLWGSREGTIYFLLENKAYFPLYISHVTSLKIWIYLLSTRFMAILFIAVFILFLKIVLKKNVYVFFLSLLIFAGEGLISERFPLLLERVRITLDTWLSTTDQLFQVIYFLLGVTIFYFLSVRFYKYKEFYH
ncbi:hypothetical protein E4665_13615 [Sporolactobacillus shoreae]|uniref:Uncharacterized protein n=1 Tax=Sporolactobacillus shoreae TaxID=1465501 RepID=A0A4Z0GJE3_9BACL|nr:hypothetical protein [Sporolactobacillus shoreae]TGA96895.1 hypothetical protein E4665_13615 [Sporolactobacillus shoreae]